jgi:hypothetical protein
MEQLTTFISSRGILKSCNAHNARPISSHPRIDPELLNKHRPGGSIYVCTDALANFAENFLPLIFEPFMLVSGDSDVSINSASLVDSNICSILSNPHLLHWYAQNLSATHPKLFSLPIGLDYHTMVERPGLWGITAISPIAQENSLLNILAASPAFNQRYLAAYCNWQFAVNRGDRQECLDKIDKSVCFFESNFVPRNSTWLRQAECMFVVSPEGAGMDCHRTWEAILLGCIPIISRSPLSHLFVELPVLIVDDWQQVNQITMLDYLKTLPERKFNFSTLFLDYWTRKIADANQEILAPTTLLDFRHLLTRKTG